MSMFSSSGPRLLSLLLLCCLMFPVNSRKSVSEGMERQGRSEDRTTVINFTDDVDDSPDAEGEYTSMSLGMDRKATLPPSFTVCAAYKVDIWNTEYNQVRLFNLYREGARVGIVNGKILLTF